jgi:Bacterial membrane protein YfhO
MKQRLRRSYEKRRGDLAALATIFVFCLIFFGWLWKRNEFIIGGDAFYYSYPLRTVAWQMIRHGTAPLWTPAVLSGYPLLSMSQLGLGYPLTWGYLFIDGPWAEQIYMLAPFLLAPIFVYGYARELGRSRLASLLAGLAFGYGGLMTGLLGVIGIPTNALMWLPLVLIAVERARTRQFASCVIGASVAYAMSVLTGWGQGFLSVAIVALAYATLLSLFVPADDVSVGRLVRWRPLAVCVAGIVFGSGLGAFQILETLRVVRRSIRAQLSYPFFLSGSFTPRLMLKSLFAPLYTDRFADVTTYVPLLVVGLAVVAGVAAFKRQGEGVRRDPRVLFWLSCAGIAFVLVLGRYTFIYPLLYNVPLFNLFQTPSRHTFEWTFALSILGAYGWDAAGARVFAKSLPLKKWILIVGASWLFLAAGAIIAVGWARATGVEGLFAVTQTAGAPPAWAAGAWYVGLPLKDYLGWKAVFTLTIFATLAFAARTPVSQRGFLLAGVILLGCFIEPFIVVRNWWRPFIKSSARLQTPAPATRWLREHIADRVRVYPRVERFTDEFNANPRVDAPNLTGLYGLESIAGYEPAILERYSRALGNVYLDAVTPLPGYAANNELFGSRSRVLDLLCTQFVVTYDPDSLETRQTIEKGGMQFAAEEIDTSVDNGRTVTLTGGRHIEGDTLALVTALSNSVDIGDGQPVARLRMFTSDGRVIERDLRAGTDTAEWAHDRADVRPVIKHRLAEIFESQPGDATASFAAHRYLARISLGTRVLVERLEITGLAPGAPVALWRATLYNSSTHSSHALTLSQRGLLAEIAPQRWRQVFDQDGVFIFENARVQPRAWLVAEAEAVDGEEAWRRIRGAGANEFDPRRTALIEAHPNDLPKLPGGPVGSASKLSVVNFEPDRILIESDAPTAAILVVSEIFYPGWEAKVDGVRAPILLTDYLLRGVPLAAGQHRVEMRYTAPAARSGAIISLVTLLLLSTLAILAQPGREVSTGSGSDRASICATGKID